MIQNYYFARVWHTNREWKLRLKKKSFFHRVEDLRHSHRVGSNYIRFTSICHRMISVAKKTGWYTQWRTVSKRVGIILILPLHQRLRWSTTYCFQTKFTIFLSFGGYGTILLDGQDSHKQPRTFWPHFW